MPLADLEARRRWRLKSSFSKTKSRSRNLLPDEWDMVVLGARFSTPIDSRRTMGGARCGNRNTPSRGPKGRVTRSDLIAPMWAIVEPMIRKPGARGFYRRRHRRRGDALPNGPTIELNCYAIRRIDCALIPIWADNLPERLASTAQRSHERRAPTLAGWGSWSTCNPIFGNLHSLKSALSFRRGVCWPYKPVNFVGTKGNESVQSMPYFETRFLMAGSLVVASVCSSHRSFATGAGDKAVIRTCRSAVDNEINACTPSLRFNAMSG